jgi:hypothetical protein
MDSRGFEIEARTEFGEEWRNLVRLPDTEGG